MFTALNGREAFKILKSQSIDVVITDILLAGTENGYSLAENIRKEFPGLKIALMTSLNKESAMESYGSDFAILSKLDLVLTANESGLSEALNSFLASSAC